jgi:hypothetical protein
MPGPARLTRLVVRRAAEREHYGDETHHARRIIRPKISRNLQAQRKAA